MRNLALLAAALLIAGGASARDSKRPDAAKSPAATSPAKVARFAAGGPAAGIRIAADLVILASKASKGEAVALAPIEPTRKPRKTAKKDPPPPAPGAILAGDNHGLAIARVPAATLDAAHLAIVPLARGPSGFGDFATIEAPGSSQESALLESPRTLYFAPRTTVPVSGTQPREGGALLNACGQLTGFLAAGGDGSAHAEAALLRAIDALLRTADVKVDPASKDCDAPVDGLARLSDKLTVDAQSSRARAAAIEQQIAALRQPASARADPRAAARIVALTRQAQDARATADRSTAAIDRIRAYRSRHSRDRVIAVILVVVALALIVAAIVIRRRDRDRVSAREESIAILTRRTGEIEKRLHARPWRDVVLQGESGILKISAAQLADGGPGAVIGRSEAGADVTFSPADISRRHARLFVADDILWIVDLDSAGGTRVNGRRVESTAPVSLANNDEIELASHRLKVRIQ